nr:IS66 family insertion sequence element accessory protein TnpB [Legionella norrlandica]
MLIPDNAKIHLYCGITVMRKSINTLAMMVKDVLAMEPTSGHLFLFRGRGGDKLKALIMKSTALPYGIASWKRVSLFFRTMPRAILS